MGMICSWVVETAVFMNHCSISFEIRKMKGQPKRKLKTILLQYQVQYLKDNFAVPFWYYLTVIAEKNM